MKGERGYVSIMAIWISAILIVLASGLVIFIQFNQRAVKNYLNHIKAFYVAKAGMNDIIFHRSQGDKEQFCTEAGLQELNNSYQNVRFGEGAYSVVLEDEKSKANLNTASEVLIKNIMNLIKIGDSDRKARAIIKWRRENGYFLHVEELGLVSDLDVNDCFMLIPYFTIYSIGLPGSNSLNVNTASKVILQAHFDEFRAPSRLTEQVISRRPFKGGDEVRSFIRNKAPGFSDDMVKYFTWSAPQHRLRVTAAVGTSNVVLNLVVELWHEGHDIICIRDWWEE
ncbi:MAG: helix-hairpin-helix domain-containing protein [Candidatus Firestonebacteria bacterium]